VKLWILSIFILLSHVGFSQEDFTLQDTSFLPARYYVGDRVELRVRLTNVSGDLRSPESLPPGSWLVVNEILCTRLREGTWEARIHFTTFRPGRHILPPIDLGAVTLSNMKAETRSILEGSEEEKPAGVKGQLILRGTWWRILGIASAIFLIPLVVFQSARMVLGFYRRYSLKRRRLVPMHRVLRALKRLKGQVEKYDPSGFFTEVTHILKSYIGARLHFSALTATTRELDRGLPVALSVCNENADPSVLHDINALLQRADLVRFGGFESSREEMHSVVDEVKVIVETLEEVVENVES
jgi:hypothetical protein